MKKITSFLLAAAICTVLLTATVFARDFSAEETLAGELKSLGIFNGVSATDFDLDRAPSRIEAVVMLVRMLGKEEEAMKGGFSHPFTDIPDWADKYIGYAYENGLANGQSLTEFGIGNATSAMYLTFVLRALGYSDADGKDFVWSDPYQLARETGILPDGVDTDSFMRGDVVLISHASLSAYLKGSKTTLSEKLVSSGVFTQKEFNGIYNSHCSAVKRELSAEEIYAKCSPAVFYVEIYNSNGVLSASGSGFFIDDQGTAVTNYHVIGNASSAKIQTSDTGEKYSVAGIYDFSAENDWAIIKVDCKDNKYLSIADPSTAVGAATVYAIGSPLGLQNTISQGIISNPARAEGNTTYIQTSAAISSGSSGGALINKYGEVIGITSAGYEEGQNLNLALPMTYLSNAKTDKLVSVEEFWTSGSRLRAINSLKLLITTYAQSVTENGGYRFVDTSSLIGGYVGYGMTYDPTDNSIDVEVYLEYYRSTVFDYRFTITAEGTTTEALYFCNKYDNGQFTKISDGKSTIELSAFSESSDYSFDEYNGGSKEKDLENAKILHNSGLEYVNNIFRTFFAGAHSLADLGYTSYE